MMTLLEKTTVAGCPVELHHDLDAEDPREFDCRGTFWAYHRRARIGDASPELHRENFGSWAEFDAAIAERPGVRVVLPVYCYEHGSRAFSTAPFGCRFDSGRVGVIFAEGGGDEALTDEELAAVLRSEIATYSAWSSGDVLGYIVRGDDGESAASCWGYYGRDCALADATDAASAYRAGIDGAARLERESFAL